MKCSPARQMNEHLSRHVLPRSALHELSAFGDFLTDAKFEWRDGHEVCTDPDFLKKAEPLIHALKIPPNTKIGAVRLRGPSDISVRTAASADLLPVRSWGDCMYLGDSVLSVGVAVHITAPVTISNRIDAVCDVFIVHW